MPLLNFKTFRMEEVEEIIMEDQVFEGPLRENEQQLLDDLGAHEERSIRRNQGNVLHREIARDTLKCTYHQGQDLFHLMTSFKNLLNLRRTCWIKNGNQLFLTSVKLLDFLKIIMH